MGGSSHIELRVGCVDVAGGVCSRGPPLVLERWTDQQGRVVLEGEDTDAPSVLVKYQLVLAQPDADCAEHARLAHQLASESQVSASYLGATSEPPRSKRDPAVRRAPGGGAKHPGFHQNFQTAAVRFCDVLSDSFSGTV